MVSKKSVGTSPPAPQMRGPSRLNPRNPIGILTGPTAVGKTQLALDLIDQAMNYSDRNVIEVISADSLLVYRGMDIGTAKPTRVERDLVPHHLIDVCNPDEPFTAGDFVRAVSRCIQEIEGRGNRAMIVGGTGFYLNALLFGLWDTPKTDPELRKLLESLSNPELFSELQKIDSTAAQRIGGNDRYRLIRALAILKNAGDENPNVNPISVNANPHSPRRPRTLSEFQANLDPVPHPLLHLWVVDRDPDALHLRVRQRTQVMIQSGLIAEAQTVRTQYGDCRPLQAVGYLQVRHYLENKAPLGRKIAPGLDGLSEEIQLATRQLIKRQRTWFRNQLKRVPGARHYLLDEQRASLEETFHQLYESKKR